MDARELLLDRRTIHDYRPEPIDDEAVDRALKCAIRAPNHKLTNPWRFTKVGPEVRDRLTDLGVELKRQKKDVDDEYEQYLRAKYGNPAHLVVVSQVLDDDPFRQKEDYAACATAIQNFCLSLWSEEIGSKWSTGSMSRHDSAYEMLDIDPEKEEIIAFVWVGVPAEIPDPPRTPLDEVVRTTS